MTCIQQRQTLLQLIQEACSVGADRKLTH